MNCLKENAFLRMVFVLLVLIQSQELLAFQDKPAKPFVVVIDAGHGGRDPGTVGKKSLEKNINLDVAMKVGFYLTNLMPDVKVVYTRTTDVFVDLSVRAAIANRNEADLFVSIHSNAVTDRSAFGSETWVMGLDKTNANFDLVTKENKVILLEEDYQATYEGFDPESPESYIMFSLMQNNNLTQSLNLAGKIQEQFKNRAQRKDRGVFQGGLLVLWKTTMPGVLVELGFLSNAREEEFLMTNNGQDIMASAIFRAIKAYKEELSTLRKEAVVTQNESVDQITKDPIPEARTEKLITPPEASDTSKRVSPPQTNSGVVFRVQLLASKTRIPLSSAHLKGYTPVDEIQLDGYYKYMTRPVSDYQEALRLRQELGSRFNGAFIVPFRNGNRVTLEEALKVP